MSSGPSQHRATTPPNRRPPPLSLNTQAKPETVTQPLKSGKLARRKVRTDFDRSYHDPESDPRAIAPWAPPEAFTPVGLENAFTPLSMKPPATYFPDTSEESLNAGVKGISIDGKEPSDVPDQKRPTRRDRLQSAPALLAERPLIPQGTPPRRQLETRALRNSRDNSPVRDMDRRATLAAPELLHPQPRRSSGISMSGSSLKQSTAVAFSKSFGRMKSLASKATKAGRRASADARSTGVKRGSFPGYQQPRSLAEHALRQDDDRAHTASDFTENLLQARDISNLSPVSCEKLYRATSSYTISEEERERASIAFNARQKVHFTPEAQAQAVLTRREIEKDRAAAHDRRRPSRGLSTFEEILGDHRSHEDLSRSLEERARSWVAEEKDEAEKMALENPDKYPGLRRR